MMGSGGRRPAHQARSCDLFRISQLCRVWGGITRVGGAALGVRAGLGQPAEMPFGPI